MNCAHMRSEARASDLQTRFLRDLHFYLWNVADNCPTLLGLSSFPPLAALPFPILLLEASKHAFPTPAPNRPAHSPTPPLPYISRRLSGGCIGHLHSHAAAARISQRGWTPQRWHPLGLDMNASMSRVLEC